MSQPPSSLVGAVVERAASSRPSQPLSAAPSTTGFPSVQHRSKSAFARARDLRRGGNQQSGQSRPNEPPIVRGSGSFASDKSVGVGVAISEVNEGKRNVEEVESREVELPANLPPVLPSSTPDVRDTSQPSMEDREWRLKMSQNNEREVEAMSEDERERHRKEIIDQLGPDIISLVRMAAEARQNSSWQNGVAHPHLRDVEESTEDDLHMVTTPHSSTGEASSLTSPPTSDSGRKRQRDGEELVQPTPNRAFGHNKLTSTPHRGILVGHSPPGSRSSTPGRALRKLRFADVTDKDIHVFASEPSSPKRPIALLLPPPEISSDDDTKSDRSSQRDSEMELIEDIRRNHFEPIHTFPIHDPHLEAGTPEDIRRRFFPNLPAHDPNLEWIEGDSSASSDSEVEPRFDLAGTVIPIEQRPHIPTHLGLHHHAGPTSAAGYTLADLYHLARSTVAAQRSTILGVLAKIVHRLARTDSHVSEVYGRRDDVRRNALSAGLAALAEKGSLGVQAIDLVWTCIVDWDQGVFDGVEGVELRPSNAKEYENDRDQQSGNMNDVSPNELSPADPLSSLPLPALLPLLVSHVSLGALPPESLSQLLAITHRLSKHSVNIATAVANSPKLIGTYVSNFLLTSIPPTESSLPPNPDAIRFLRTLAHCSRDIASTLVGPADALLRFITTAIPLSNSPFPLSLSEALLCETLDFYAVLAGYGLYTGIATTAADHFNQLSTYVFSENNASERLTSSWLRLLDAWMVAARDPHRTTPHHDLLWSQVVGWSWGTDILAYRSKLLKRRSSPHVWGDVWGALSSWLEGCRLNSQKAGRDERAAVSASIEELWSEEGSEKEILLQTLSSLNDVLSAVPSPSSSRREQVQYYGRLSDLSTVTLHFSRLLFAVCPSGPERDDIEKESTSTASWIIDASRNIRILARDMANNLPWPGSPRFVDDADFSTIRYRLLQPIAAFLASSAKITFTLSKSLDWLPFALCILQRLLPGEEATACRLVEEVIRVVSSQQQGLRGHLLLPFIFHEILPKDGLRLSPAVFTPESIQQSTTQCLPASCSPASTSRTPFSLPLKSDWPTLVLNHLLRSGTSGVFANPDGLPSSWDASEVDLVRISLSVADHLQCRLGNSTYYSYAMSCERVVFACMKVFMLEHEQQHNDSSEEVYRDPEVSNLMDDLLRPFTISERGRAKKAPEEDLEVVAKEYLGKSIPFYQFYTDFVALYDAISFAHKTFGRLLLVPTSMKYPLDYRKHLWGDFGHILKSIRVPIDDVIADDLTAFLWPFETDAGMIGWYLRALVKWPLDGFLHFVAVHHVACNIWPDLQEGPVREKRAKMLLLAVVNQARPEVVKDVVRYTQAPGTLTHLPQHCFNCDEHTVGVRLEYVGEWGGAQMMSKLEKIFGERP